VAQTITLASGVRYIEHAPGCWQLLDRSGPGWRGCMSLQGLVEEIERMTYVNTRILRSGPTRAERKRAKNAATR
jgi:hypothetical protein